MSSEDKSKSRGRKSKEEKIDITESSVPKEETKVSSSFCKQPKQSKKPKIKEDQNVDTTFVLKDINYISLDRNYGMKDIQEFIFKNINTTSNKEQTDTIVQNNKTSKKVSSTETKNTASVALSSLLSSSNLSSNKNEMKSITTKLESLGFSDKVKEPFETICRGNNKSNIYTTFNNSIKKELVSNCCSFNCWYCRNQLINNTLPVVIPLKYYNSYTECSLIHNSLINTVQQLEYGVMDHNSLLSVKDKDKIFYEKVNLTENDKKKLNLKNSSNRSLISNDYFEGEGIFCSFNCVVAYISENYSIKYKNSGLLLNKLYKNIFGFLPNEKFIPSPSWKMLKQYGGELSIEEYRKTFQTIDYSCNWQYLKCFPNGPVSELYLEKKV